ncbi:hypothetical protein ACFLR4_03110 [Bacteroidota bacterium]
MSWRTVGSILAIIIGFIAGKFAYNALFGESEIASYEIHEWLNRSYIGVTFEAPFELSEADLELPLVLKPYVKNMETYNYESKAVALFLSKIEYNPDIPVDIDGAAEGAAANMGANEDVTEFNYEVEKIEKNFIEGRRMTGGFKLNDKDTEFVAELYVQKSKLLQILITNLSYPENREVRDRILKSFKVTL